MCDRFPVKINPAILYPNMKVCNILLRLSRVTSHWLSFHKRQYFLLKLLDWDLWFGVKVQPPFYCDYIIFIVSGLWELVTLFRALHGGYLRESPGQWRGDETMRHDNTSVRRILRIIDIIMTILTPWNHFYKKIHLYLVIPFLGE